MSDSAKIGEDARIRGNAKLGGSVEIAGRARVMDYVQLDGKGRIGDDALIRGWMLYGYLNAEIFAKELEDNRHLYAR